MGRIAVEIVPRDEAGLRGDIEVIKKYPQVDCVNDKVMEMEDRDKIKDYLATLA